MASHYRVTDNAAPRLMPKSLTAEMEATCGYQLCYRILSHVGRAQRVEALYVSCMGIGPHTLQANAYSPGREACVVDMAHAIHLYSWGFVRRKSWLLWLKM